MSKPKDKLYLEFRTELSQDLASRGITLEYLKTQGKSGWLFVGTITTLFFLLLALFVSGKYIPIVAPLLGVIMAIKVQYLMHETTHNTLFVSKKLNTYARMYSTAVISYFDFPRYHIEHHANTNHTTKDIDYYNLGDFLGITPNSTPKFWHKKPHIVFYIGLPVLCLINTFKSLLMSPWSAIQSSQANKFKLFHLLIWFAFLFILNIFPFIAYGFSAKAFYMALIPRVMQWYVHLNLFQWSHFHNEKSEALKSHSGEVDVDFFRDVLETTQNVSERNWLMRFLIVGHQIQHHLLPNVSGSKTHLLIDSTRSFSEKHNIQYNHTQGLLAQIKVNYRFYKNKSIELTR